MPDWWTAPLGGEQPEGDPGHTRGESAASAAPLPPGAGAVQPAALDCLAKAIAHEAGNEPLAGRQAVAQVILNRVRHRAYPNTVCGVVFQGSERRTGCQFTFTCDGSLRRALSRRTWEAALAVAEQALLGRLPPTVGAATHYHAVYVAPRWAPALDRVASIGAHIFYQFPGARRHATGAPPPPPALPGSFNPWGLSVAGTAEPST